MFSHRRTLNAEKKHNRSGNTKEKAWESKPCLSHRLGLRIAHLSRINNADAHANGYT